MESFCSNYPIPIHKNHHLQKKSVSIKVIVGKKSITKKMMLSQKYLSENFVVSVSYYVLRPYGHRNLAESNFVSGLFGQFQDIYIGKMMVTSDVFDLLPAVIFHKYRLLCTESS